MHAVVPGVTKSRTWLSDWTELKTQQQKKSNSLIKKRAKDLNKHLTKEDIQMWK